jgi:hypothetical protein
MPKKYQLHYTGTGPGQSSSIERAGYVFIRGCSTEVPKAVFDELKGEPGFETEEPADTDKED